MAALFLAATSCGRPPAPETAAPQVPESLSIRKEFVILRELTKQHALQTESGNELRLETVIRHLQERLNSLPPPPFTPEELTILEQARQAASGR